MRRRLFAVLAVVACVTLVSARPAPQSAAEEVVAVTKAQWAAEMRGDISGAMKNVAEEYTEFNDDYPTRLDGRPINTHLAEANAPSSVKLVAAEMANEKVQTYGDVAILSYNFIGATKDKDGKIEPSRAKSTRVYVKRGGQWWLVHANFAPAR